MTFDLTTFVFELVNFVVLAFVLGRFVFRPIAGAITARRAEIEGTRARAAEGLALVDTRQAEIDARNQELDDLRQRIFAEATAEAASERAKLMAQAREDASAERARVQSLLEVERTTALGWVREAAVDQGTEIAGILLQKLVPEAAHEALVAYLIRAIGERSDDLRAELADGAGEAEVTYARFPSREEADALLEALEEAIGGTVRVSTATDEELGAGVVLRFGDRVLDASVKGQLELLREEARRQLDDGAQP
jgi:F-type H+-transporting ATPase subunit b